MKTQTWIFAIIVFDFGRALAFSETAAWPAREVHLTSDRTHCPRAIDVEALVTSAMAVWNAAPGNPVRLTYSEMAEKDLALAVVSCESNFEMVTGADSNRVPAAATVQSREGEIHRARLLLNTSGGQANISVYDQATLRIVIAHELGHVLGLGHSADPNSLMYYNATGKSSLWLSQEDVENLQFLYPLSTRTRKLGLQLAFDFTSLKSNVDQLFNQLRVRVARGFHHLGIHTD